MIEELIGSKWGIGLALAAVTLVGGVLMPSLGKAARPGVKAVLKFGMGVYRDALSELEEQAATDIVEGLAAAV